MPWRWVLTWTLSTMLVCGLGIVWIAADHNTASTASSVAAAGLAFFSTLAVWAWHHKRPHTPSTTEQVSEAAQVLARLVRRQWQDEATLRQLFDPAPLPVVWSDHSLADVSDHRQLIGAPMTCRADAQQELATAFRRLPRRRLVVLGPPGSGKTTLAVLLTLALLDDRDPAEPVPVLLSLASFDPAREGARTWLRRRIAADYPALAEAEAFGPSVIDDLLTEGRILPVLDALDERPEASRPGVLEALNDAFGPQAPMILTCRTAEYASVVSDVGVLPQAAVIASAPMDPHEVLAVLRLATPPGPRQEQWAALADQITAAPDGPVAQALTSPLTVSLARAVYADALGDPAELADSARFPTPHAVERHLLDAFVFTTFSRARRQNPEANRWEPDRSHRYVTYLAKELERRDTYDFAWWQLYQWVPTLARPARRVLTWAIVGTAIVFLLDYANWCAPLLSPSCQDGDYVIFSMPGMLRLVGLLVCTLAVAAWATTRPWFRTHHTTAAVATGICGGLAGGLFYQAGMEARYGTWTSYTLQESVSNVLTEGLWMAFLGLMVLLSAGLPVPPRMPSQAAFTLRHWRHHLPKAIFTIVLAVGFSTSALHLIDLMTSILYDVQGEWKSWRSSWVFGLGVGVFIGAAQAVTQWTRNTIALHTSVGPDASLRADRQITLINAAVGASVLAMANSAMGESNPLSDSTGEVLVTTFLRVMNPTSIVSAASVVGVVIAGTAYAWPHYTLARFLLASQGKLPWRLQAFLAEARRLGILRQVGPVYQFRHARLQDHLAMEAPSRPVRQQPDAIAFPPETGVDSSATDGF